MDCTDNLSTRYLLSDTAVLLGIPLVSGSALKTEGQLSVYSHGDAGPCYRCIYPKPPAATSVTNCSDGGVRCQPFPPPAFHFATRCTYITRIPCCRYSAWSQGSSAVWKRLR